MIGYIGSEGESCILMQSPFLAILIFGLRVFKVYASVRALHVLRKPNCTVRHVAVEAPSHC